MHRRILTASYPCYQVCAELEQQPADGDLPAFKDRIVVQHERLRADRSQKGHNRAHPSYFPFQCFCHMNQRTLVSVASATPPSTTQGVGGRGGFLSEDDSDLNLSFVASSADLKSLGLGR